MRRRSSHFPMNHGQQVVRHLSKSHAQWLIHQMRLSARYCGTFWIHYFSSENFRKGLSWKYYKYKEWVSILWGINRSAEQPNRQRTASRLVFSALRVILWTQKQLTRGPTGHISCTWVQYATFFDRSDRTAIILFFQPPPPKKKNQTNKQTNKTKTKNTPPPKKKSKPKKKKKKKKKNTHTNLEEDVMLPFKFRWIPFSGCRGEVWNVSVNQRSGRPFCFSDQPEKRKLGRGRWDIDSCQVSLNSFQQFQSRYQSKISQPIRGQGGHLVFSDGPEKFKHGRGR